MSTLPTIILIHGAWHTPPNHLPLITALQAAGYPTHCPHLPSCTNTSPPPFTFADDVLAARTAITPHVEAGESVLVLMHSYGGAVGTDAVTDSLLSTTRAAKGAQGGVVHLLYLCAYILQPGNSIFSIAEAAGFLPYWPQYVNNYADGSCFPVDAATMFFSDDRPDEAGVEDALKHLTRFPLAAFRAESRGDAWRKMRGRVTYVKTGRDGAVPGVYQDIMLKRVEEEGIDVEVVEVDAGHSLAVTRVGEMVELVRRLVGKKD